MLSTRNSFQIQPYKEVKVKQWERIYDENTKKSISFYGEAILTTKGTLEKRKFPDKERYCIVIKGSIHQEDITTLNAFT